MIHSTYLETLAHELSDAQSKIQILVDIMSERGILEDGTFTFADGETWVAWKHYPEVAMAVITPVAQADGHP